jgi:hypothetical protein
LIVILILKERKRNIKKIFLKIIEGSQRGKEYGIEIYYQSPKKRFDII